VIDVYGDYSFDVIGCSDGLNDMTVDLVFDGDEYYSATYSLTSCALDGSNIVESTVLDASEDADNDGTNNVNDLDSAGDFLPILIKTHESATNAFFGLDFNEDDITIWTEDSNAMITRTNSYIPNGNKIQSYHNYSYDDLFSEGTERTLYVQGLEAGEHELDFVYVLDNQEVAKKDLSLSFFTVDLDYDLWWFNGENPANYHTDATLSADWLDTGHFQWEVTQGADKVELDGGPVGWANSVIIQDDNSVAIRSKAASAGTETVTKDVTITLTHNGQEVCSYDLAVFTPDHNIFLRNHDQDSYDFGYTSYIHYRVEDQFDRTLPYQIGVNEKWTSDVEDDYPDMTWRRFDAGGNLWNPADWKDKIDGEYSYCTPTPIKPSDNDPAASTPVYHWTGDWYIGSTISGKGVKVKSGCVWQKYRGYARHE